MEVIKHILYRTAWAVAIGLMLTGCGQRNRPASDYEVWGIDVSRHQQGIRWERLCEADRPHFVYLKATEGTLIQDPSYDRHRKQLTELGIPWGAYHFFGHRTSGKEQAQNFIRTAQLEKGNLYPVLDVEPHRFFKSQEKMVEEMRAFCTEIRREYGVDPIIYCSSNFYKQYLEEDFPAKKYHLWIANYSEIPEVDWQFWQHTDSYTTQGYNRGLDRNVFTGGIDQLDKLTLK
ncbi:MAG: hypothetical protein LBM20_01195 [Rikenellaceae bacterium]|nr:hypothetical protein [Rikenellaceae bacterium]